METSRKTGLDYSNQAIKIELQKAMSEIRKRISERKLVVEGDLNLIENINLDNATRSSKKKMAKKIHYFLKTGTRRKMNAMLAFICRRFLQGEKKIIILPSVEQQAIEKSRKEFKEQLKVMLEKKKIYKELKTQFKESGGTYDN